MSSSTRQAGDGDDDGGGVELARQTTSSQRAHTRATFEQEQGENVRLGGRAASKYYARLRAERDQEREKQRQAQNTPKAIEARLRNTRALRSRRRGWTSGLPSPVRATRRFLADPVTRFWLGCNVCTVLVVFGGSALFMIYLYPMMLRPTLKCMPRRVCHAALSDR